MAYDEAKALERYAMTMFMDPATSEADRSKAKARLMRAGDDGVDWSKLPTAELREVNWAFDVVVRDQPSVTPSTRAKLENAMAIAQSRWEQLVAECAAAGQPTPSPIYAFKSTAITPHDNRGELVDGEQHPEDGEAA